MKKSEESQRVLDRLDKYIEEHCSEPMKWLVRFWKDQAAVLKYSELLSIVTDEDVPEKIFNDWFGDYSRLLAEKVTPLWKETMIAAVMDNPLFQNVGEEFNTADIYVRDWIANRSATLVTACLDEQRQAIRYIIGEGKMNRWSTQETARYIRPTIGLTERQAAANQKYYNTIKEQTRRDHPRMTDEAVERKAREAAGRYAAKQQRYRAETISRTELATAYNEGNDQYVRQIVRNGYLPAGKKYVKVWSTAGNNICPECEALEGTEVDMDEEFKVVRGKTVKRELTALKPPLHPRCKCAALYEERDEDAELAENTRNDVNYDILGVGAEDEKEDTFYEILGTCDYADAEKELSRWNEQFRYEYVENAVVIDKNGTIHHFVGSESNVGIFGVDLNGAFITHNHPESEGIVSFGADDLSFLRDNQNVAGLQCVNPEYTYKIAGILKPLDGLVYNSLYREVMESIDPFAENVDLQDKVMQLISERGYIRYEKIRFE